MSDAQLALHEAIQACLGDGEIAVCWTLTIDVAGPDDTRYLAHRAGGGADGHSHPSLWVALGMLLASARTVEDQLSDNTHDSD
jgi:hypothetical protein